jgi:hypothetical protein
MFRILLAICGLLGLLAACGDSDDTATAGTDTTEPSDSTDTTGAPGGGGTTEADENATSPAGGGGGTVAELTIVVEHPDTGSVTYQLACLGDTATLSGDEVDVVDQEACAALADPAVVTRLVQGAPQDQVCTEIYGGPDLATITGTIDDQPVDTVVDRANGCGINDWDVLLAALLPTALGVTG